MASGLNVSLFADNDLQFSRQLGIGYLEFVHLSDCDTEIPWLTNYLRTLPQNSPLPLPPVPMSVPSPEIAGLVAVVEVSKNNLRVTAKPSLLKAALARKKAISAEGKAIADGNEFASDISDIQPDRVLLAWIRGFSPSGVMVQLPAGLRAFAPLNMISDTRLPLSALKSDIMDASGSKSSLVSRLLPYGATVRLRPLASSLNSTQATKTNNNVKRTQLFRSLVSLRFLDVYTSADQYYVNEALQHAEVMINSMLWMRDKHGLVNVDYIFGSLEYFDIPIYSHRVTHFD
ncbi:unnamed protein product [Protopolystoma xenopodis]|uniref:Uncharacterized protein n=1 Tax=Protopolystoma xenopodis TaxID=117903 RepID=A0A3S5AS04_9PLAT|nr:unnamed protein product [Protopolystoma xenopodis]